MRDVKENIEKSISYNIKSLFNKEAKIKCVAAEEHEVDIFLSTNWELSAEEYTFSVSGVENFGERVSSARQAEHKI